MDEFVTLLFIHPKTKELEKYYKDYKSTCQGI